MSTPSRLAVTPIIATKGAIGLFWVGKPVLGTAIMTVALLTVWLLGREFGYRFRDRTTGE